MSITNIFVQLGFLWGSYLFLSSDTADLKFGDELFIFGSVITFAFALFGLIESRAHWANYYEAEREDRIEFLESTMFFFAGVVFLVGSIFFWPGIYDWWYEGEALTVIHDMEISGESHGARCFIAGSTLFLVATMFNAIGLGMNKEEAEKNPVSVATHYIHVAALMCSQFGSVLFVAGSFMYRPVGPEGGCSEYNARYEGEAQAGEDVAEHACVTTGEFGTWLYIYGSILYLIESILNFINSALKHKYVNDGKVGHKPEEESDIEADLIEES